MDEIIPDDIRTDLAKACRLHDRALADPTQCTEFSRLMSDILSRLEDMKCYETADRVMSILLDCNPKTGAHCDKSTIVSQATQKILKKVTPKKHSQDKNGHLNRCHNLKAL